MTHYFQDKTLCLSSNHEFCMKVIRTFHAQPVKIPHLRACWRINKHGDPNFLFQFFNVQIMNVNYAKFHKKFKVHLAPKYFFHSNKSLHLFETHCAFLPLFNWNLDFLQAVKFTKSGHHLLHDRASKGYGSIPRLRSQTCMHVYKDLIRHKSVCDVHPGIEPYPLLTC